MYIVRIASVALLALSLAGCPADHSGMTGPAEQGPTRSASPSRNLRFVHRAPQTPPFKEEIVALEARVGETSSATLHFADGSAFARFTISPESMRGATLDGRQLGADETITITLRRVDASRYLIDLQPSGLVFNGSAPAELVFFYGSASLDEATPMEVWKQEGAGDRWIRTPSEVDRGTRRMHARVDDFTIYALAIPS